MRITKIRWTHRLRQSLLPREKNLGKSGQKLPKRRYQLFFVQLQTFCSGLFCPALSGKTNFPKTCPSVIQRTIFWHFSELQSLFTKISIEQTEVQHEAWNLCEQIHISVNYPWRHSTFKSLPIIISLFFIFTLILIEASLKF